MPKRTLNVFEPTDLAPSKMSTLEVSERQACAQQASLVLGYSAFEHEVLKAERRNTLAATLKELGIKIFDTEQVRTYMDDSSISHSGTSNANRDWVSSRISQYKGLLSIYTVTMLLQIKKSVPAVEYFVEELCNMSHSEVVLLYAALDGEVYYLDVFDEQGRDLHP